MRSFYIAALLSIVLAGCSEQIYLVGIDSDPEKATRIFYIPTVNKQVPKAELDTTKHTADKIFKVLSAAVIKDFGGAVDIQETSLKGAGSDYSYQYEDWDGDGVKDLFAINRKGFTATDIHILSGATGYKGFLLQQPIGIPKSDYHTDFAVADVNKDGSQDLFVFERQVNSNVKLVILSGRVAGHAPAFMHKLYETTLDFADPNATKAFEMYDIDKDAIQDLVVIDKEFQSASGGKETKVLVYSGASKFQKLISSSVTPIQHSCMNCTFVMDEFLAENTLDLISIDDSDPQNTKIDVLSGTNKYRDFIKKDTLKWDASFKNAVFFSDDKLPEVNGNPKGLETTFNPMPILKNVSGPQDLSNFTGQWELKSAFHSNDDNSRTGIEIDNRTLDSNLTADGWQGISITFEDGYIITCQGKEGNVVCSDNYTIASVHHNYFYLVDDKGNHKKIERYIENIDLGFLLFHNGAAYDANVWGSWTEIGFGGTEKNVTTEKFYLSLAGGLDGVNVHNEHTFAIPRSAKNVRLYMDPVGGLKTVTINNPPIDNSCYRIKGDLLSAAFSSNYQYYDKDCTGSSTSQRIEAAISFQNSDLYKVLSSRIKKLRRKGFFSSLHPNDPTLHETVKNKIFNVQVMNAIQVNDNPFGQAYDDSPFSVNSISLGWGGGGEVIVGYSGDGGKIDDSEEQALRYYHSNGVTYGIELGVELSIVIGLWKQHISEMNPGWSFGGGAGAAIGLGGTILFWNSAPGGPMTGITISIDYGGEGKAVELISAYTTLGPIIPYANPTMDQE